MCSDGSKGDTRDECSFSGPKFLHFHAVFGKNWSDNRLMPHWGVPLHWEILDPPLKCENTYPLRIAELYLWVARPV